MELPGRRLTEEGRETLTSELGRKKIGKGKRKDSATATNAIQTAISIMRVDGSASLTF